MNLAKKRILLTGATGGIGQPIAHLLAKNGAHLALVGRDLTVLKSQKTALEAFGVNVAVIQADLAQTGVAQSIYADAKQQLGEIDIVINNAGVLDFIDFAEQTPERIAQMVQTNVTALIQLTNAAMPDFNAKNAGHFVMIGSIFGSLGFPHFATYCATKFAVHGFSQALRRELVDSNIGVTYIAPRGIKTPMNNDNTVAMWAKTGNQIDDAETVANIVVDALIAEKQEVFIGQPQTFFAWLNGVAPKLVNIGLKKQTALAAPFLKKPSK